MDRERVFHDSGTSQSYPEYWLQNGKIVYQNNYTWIDTYRYAAMKDFVVPSFKRRRSAGEIFQNPFTSVTKTSAQQPLIMFGESQVSTWHETHELCYPIPVSITLPSTWLALSEWFAPLTESINDAAIAEAWARVDVSEMQALASLGEMPETVKWIASIMQRAVILLRCLRNKNTMIKWLKKQKGKPKLRTSFETVGDFWLEFRYAFRPLVYEMKSAVEALKASIDKAIRYTARGKETSESEATDTVPYTQGGIKASISYSQKYALGARAGVLYRVKSEINDFMAIWGFNQPFETVWELTPFSFILDWFFNIGKVISAWTANPGLETLSSWSTTKVYVQRRWDFTNVVRDPSIHYYNVDIRVMGEGWAEETVAYKIRVPNPDRPLLPSFRVNLDFGKILDLAFIGQKLLGNLLKGEGSGTRRKK